MERTSEHRGAAFVEEKGIIGGIVLRVRNWAQVMEGTYWLMIEDKEEAIAAIEKNLPDVDEEDESEDEMVS